MEKLITIKDKCTGKIMRVSVSLSKAVSDIAKEHGRLENYVVVPKKLYKRKVRDENLIRSKRAPQPFGSKLNERLALKYGRKSN